MAYAFETAPPLGHILMDGDQQYALHQVQPFTRADGSVITMLVWVSGCAVCGKAFLSRGPLNGKNLTRRCVEHKQARAPASPAAKERMRAAAARGRATARANRKARRKLEKGDAIVARWRLTP